MHLKFPSQEQRFLFIPSVFELYIEKIVEKFFWQLNFESPLK